MNYGSISRFSKVVPCISSKTASVKYSELLGINVEYPESRVDKSYFESSQSAVKRIKSLGNFNAPLPYDENPYALSAEVARLRSRGAEASEIYQSAIKAEQQFKSIIRDSQVVANSSSQTVVEPTTPTQTTTE